VNHLKLASLLLVASAALLLGSSPGRAATELWPVTTGNNQPVPFVQVEVKAVPSPITNNAGGFAVKDVFYYTGDSNGLVTMSNLLIGTFTASAIGPYLDLTPVSFTITNFTSTSYVAQNPAVTISNAGFFAAYPMATSDARYPSVAGSNITFTTVGGRVRISATGGGNSAPQSPITNDVDFAAHSITGINDISMNGSGGIGNSITGWNIDDGGNATLGNISDGPFNFNINASDGSASFNGLLTSGTGFSGDGHLLTSVAGGNITAGTVNSNSLDTATKAQLFAGGVSPITNLVSGSGILATTNSGTKTVTVTTNGAPLAGDVTGPTGVNVVATVGGQTAANVAAGAVLANAAVSADTPNTLVKRDSTGGFSAVSLTLGDTAQNSPHEFVVILNTGTFASSTGDAGIILQSLSTNLFQSGTSLFISATGLNGSGNAIVTDRVAGSFAYVAPGHLEELCTGCFISVFNNATNVEGYGICSPGIGFDSGNYATEWNQFRGTTFWGVPFWQPGVYKPSGHGYTFHVSGVTVTPTSPSVYTNSAGVIFVVNATSIAAGSGTVNTSATAAPAGSGTLGKVTIPGQANTGDNTLTYSSVDTITWQWSVNVNPNNGIFNAFKSEVLTGSLTVNGNIWTATQTGQSNMINGGMIGPNSTLTVSNAVFATTPPGSALAVDISGGGGSGFKMVGNGLGVIFQSQQMMSVNNNGSSVGNAQFRLEGTGTGNEINPQNDGAYDLGDASKRYGSAFVKNSITVGTTKISSGNGSPNGSVTGSPGDEYFNTAGGSATTLYVKESGTATTSGWVGK
jgi:hypothetical protein